MKNILNKAFPQMPAEKYARICSYLHTGIILAIFAAFLMSFKVAEVPTLSMYPTLDRGEVVFCHLTKNVTYGVIGMEGDTIAIHDGAVWRNGEKLEELYLNEGIVYTQEEVTVPADNYYVMGDNRNVSIDSHVIGTIPHERLFAKALFHFNISAILPPAAKS